MHFSIRYLTEYRYPSPVTDNLNALRVRPATNSTQRVRRVPRAHRSGGARQPPPRLLRHRGARVRDPDRARVADDRRARARRHVRAAEPADGRLGGARELRLPRGGRRVPAAVAGPAAGSRPRRPVRLACDREQPVHRSVAAVRADPRHVRLPPGHDVRRLDDRRPARGRRRRLPGLRPPRAGAAAPPRDRRALRLRLPVGGAAGRRRRLCRGRHARVAGGAAAGHRRAQRAGVGRRRPDQPASSRTRRT